MLLTLLFSCIETALWTEDTVQGNLECPLYNEVDVYAEDTATETQYAPIWTDHLYQAKTTHGIDIFWVIDPSGSMQNDQDNIIQGINQMIASLPTSDWRLMIMPTDWMETTDLDSFPLVPGDSTNDAYLMYQRNVKGSHEKGFDAIIEYLTINPYSATWVRPEAAKLIVFVSDEDDQSDFHILQYPDFNTWYSNYTLGGYIASIVNMPVDTSECYNPHAEDVGHRYIEATNAVNGVVIDICADDWSLGVSQATQQITLKEYIDLSHTPLNPEFIFVYWNGVLNHDWRYEASENRVYFTVLPAGGTLVEVSYNY